MGSRLKVIGRGLLIGALACSAAILLVACAASYLLVHNPGRLGPVLTPAAIGYRYTAFSTGTC